MRKKCIVVNCLYLIDRSERNFNCILKIQPLALPWSRHLPLTIEILGPWARYSSFHVRRWTTFCISSTRQIYTGVPRWTISFRTPKGVFSLMMISIQILHYIWWNICLSTSRSLDIQILLSVLLHCSKSLLYARPEAMEKILPIILAKSCIRSDLLECIKASSLCPIYRDEPVITNATSKYISVCDLVSESNISEPFPEIRRVDMWCRVPARIHGQWLHHGIEILSSTSRAACLRSKPVPEANP